MDSAASDAAGLLLLPLLSTFWGDLGYGYGVGVGVGVLLRTCIQDSLLHGMLTTVPELPGLDLIFGALLLAEH